jgi:hypothetical protein
VKIGNDLIEMTLDSSDLIDGLPKAYRENIFLVYYFENDFADFWFSKNSVNQIS